MKVIIVLQIKLIVVDGVCQSFDLAPFNPPGEVAAISWIQDKGQVQNKDNSLKDITQLPEWASSIVNKFKEIRNKRSSG